MERYEAKRAVIIGGTSGIGLATAKMLLDGGARVLVTGRSQAGLEAAQNELGKGGVVVSSDTRSLSAVSPGPTDTPIIGKAFPDKDVAAQLTEQMREANPMKRFGTPEEVAKAVLFLAFDTTGAELPVDGGWSQL
jgi:NAD(P)-dependent dehydrogenase (short-subunit alcohol dehydrogenase family)